jgi:hypothetical protein
MTTEKQIEANRQNAVKHGISARDLIVTSGDGLGSGIEKT